MESLETIFRERELFLNSPTKIFCSTCGIVFYEGSTRKYLDSLFYDFKMLAFRHVWDTKHSVKIETAYLTLRKNEFRKGIEAYAKGKYEEAVRILRHIGFLPLNLVGFDLSRFNPELQLDYSSFVDDLRMKFKNTQDKRLNHTFEENWDDNSSCFCSECKKEYHSPREACYCCQETKSWMPWFEVNSLRR